MATPFRIDHVASVTRKGCSLRIEIIRPFSAPTESPSARMADDQMATDAGVFAELGRGDDRAEADHAANGQVDAAAQKHDRLAGRGQHQRHRRCGIEVQFVQREDAGLVAAIDGDDDGEHQAGHEEWRAIEQAPAPIQRPSWRDSLSMGLCDCGHGHFLRPPRLRAWRRREYSPRRCDRRRASQQCGRCA